MLKIVGILISISRKNFMLKIVGILILISRKPNHTFPGQA